MQVLVNSDNHITGTESVTARVEEVVRGALDRFSDRITRVEVHLGDVNSHKGGERDKRCMIEARLGGLKPIAVSHQAATVADALDAATEKLLRALERTLGRLDATPGRTPDESEISDVEELRRIERDSTRPHDRSGH